MWNWDHPSRPHQQVTAIRLTVNKVAKAFI